MRPFWIDTDTASDDAVAILMALRWHDVRVTEISIVAGNVPLDQGVTNAIYTAELCGSDVPVYRGADRPREREPSTGQFFHGPDGMGGMNCQARRSQESEHAVDALTRTYREAPGETTLVTLGPLTNIALAIERDPDFAGHVPRCYVMGGAACTVGNITPAAEFNIWCDPEAARMVFRSGMPITMVGGALSRRGQSGRRGYGGGAGVRHRLLDVHARLQPHGNQGQPRMAQRAGNGITRPGHDGDRARP